MVSDVIKLLYDINPDKLNLLVQAGYSFPASNYLLMTTSDYSLRAPWKLFDDIYIEANLSAHSCVKFIDSLLTEFCLDKAMFKINIISEEEDDDSDDE